MLFALVVADEQVFGFLAGKFWDQAVDVFAGEDRGVVVPFVFDAVGVEIIVDLVCSFREWSTMALPSARKTFLVSGK